MAQAKLTLMGLLLGLASWALGRFLYDVHCGGSLSGIHLDQGTTKSLAGSVGNGEKKETLAVTHDALALTA